MSAVLEKTSGLELPTYDIMVDIDDVVMPWAWVVHEKAQQMGLHDGSRPWTGWHMWDDYGCSKEEWENVVIACTQEGLYTSTSPFPLAVEALTRLYWRGHRLHVVTARGTNWGAAEDKARIHGWTKQWLETYAIPHHTLSFAHNKVAAMQQLGVDFDFAVDDGLHNYKDLAEAGVPVYLHTQPHNVNDVVDRRVATLWEFSDIVLAAS